MTLLTSGLISRPTHAESFFHKTTCDLMSFLGEYCQRTSPLPTGGPTTSTQNSTTKDASGNTTPTKNQTPSATQPVPPPVYTPIDPQTIPDETLPEIAPIPDTSRSVGSLPGAGDSDALSSVHGGGTGEAVLGASAQAPIQSSSQGWEVFGIGWYWFFAPVVGVFLAWQIVRTSMKKTRHSEADTILKF